MTKLLILSDSHNSRLAIENILAAEADSIDALVFLGDGLRDLEQTLTLYPRLRAYAVAGNCDFGALEPLDGLAAFDGVVVFYTHGHMYGVKYDLDTLSDAAAARGANVALFGHTHVPVAEQRGDVFLFNPGSIGKQFYMDMLQLDEAEFELIQRARRGECLYKCGMERYHLEVKAPTHKAVLFGSAGGR